MKISEIDFNQPQKLGLVYLGNLVTGCPESCLRFIDLQKMKSAEHSTSGGSTSWARVALRASPIRVRPLQDKAMIPATRPAPWQGRTEHGQKDLPLTASPDGAMGAHCAAMMPAAKSAGFETALQKVRLWFGHSDCMVCQPYTNTYRNALIIIGFSKSVRLNKKNFLRRKPSFPAILENHPAICLSVSGFGQALVFLQAVPAKHVMQLCAHKNLEVWLEVDWQRWTGECKV